MNNINWGLLRYALITSREGSASRAAMKLGVTHATIIRGLKKLEDSTGTKLFNKSPSGYTPTEHGFKLIQYSNEIELLMNTWLEEVERTSELTSGILRISTTEGIANGFLCPKLASFYKCYPDIQLNVNTSYEFCNLTRYEADVALRSTNSPPEHLIGKRISKVTWAIYKSKIEGSSENHWIDSIDKSILPARWLQELFPDAKVRYKATSITNHIEATKSGLGKAILPCFIADQDSKLEKVDSLPDEYCTHLWLLYNKELKNNPKVKAFVKWIYEQIDNEYI